MSKERYKDNRQAEFAKYVVTTYAFRELTAGMSNENKQRLWSLVNHAFTSGFERGTEYEQNKPKNNVNTN